MVKLQRFDSALWPAMFVALLAPGWLLPNHYPPWTTFHLDAWIAAVLGVGALVVTARSHAPVAVSGMALLAGLLALLPGLQYFTGELATSGNAWVCTAYLAGFALAVLVGARWETLRPGHLLDCLSLAIGAACIVSVGLQLVQWLGMDVLDIWSMGSSMLRPHANLGQPNQLATFLLWGLLALLWGVLQGRIGVTTAVFCALYLLTGIALASSRTSWIGLFIIVLAVWHWRSLFASRLLPWTVSALALAFCAMVALTPAVNRALFLTDDSGGIDNLARLGYESRPRIWALFLDAAWQRPWWGYGWNQVALADLEVAERHPAMHLYFMHAHNLFLDLVLWCGLPIGLAASAFIVWWFWRRFRAVRSARAAVMMLFLLVMANHAMLELPLHHAYFLLPFGLILGALDQHLAVVPVLRLPRMLAMGLAMLILALLALIVRDYLRVEASYQQLRFEWARIKSPPATIPDVRLLDQWPDFFRFVKMTPAKGLSEAELDALRRTAALNPGAATLQKLAIVLALNGHPDEAALWLRRMCSTATPFQCELVRKAWSLDAQLRPELARVPWPPATP